MMGRLTHKEAAWVRHYYAADRLRYDNRFDAANPAAIEHQINVEAHMAHGWVLAGTLAECRADYAHNCQADA